MSLPGITAPPGTPVFQLAGHSVEEDSVYAQVKFATGHSRSRRRWTVTERVVTVSWWLDAAHLYAVDYWYENTLQAGTLEFAARVKHLGSGMRWWTARWIEFQCEMKTLQRGRVTGRILLTGTGSATGPDTSSLSAEISVELLSQPRSLGVDTNLAAEISVALVSLNQAKPKPPAGSLVFTGIAPAMTRTFQDNITPAPGSIVFAGQEPFIPTPTGLAPGVGVITISGQAPLAQKSAAIQIGAGSISFAGQAPTAWNPLLLSNLWAWYDASDNANLSTVSGLVSQLNDLSGNARHATQSNATYRFQLDAGLNSHQGLYTGTTRGPWMTFPGLSTNGSISIFVVARAISNKGSVTLIGPSAGGVGTFGYGTNAPNQIICEVRSGGALVQSVDSGIYSPHTFGMTHDGTTVRGYYGGSVYTSTAGSAPSGLFFDDFGFQSPNGTYDYVGWIGEVILVNGLMSSQEIASLKAYFATKWGVSSA